MARYQLSGVRISKFNKNPGEDKFASDKPVNVKKIPTYIG